MGKKTWASSAQQEWLWSKIPDFGEAQAQKTTNSFFSEVYTAFHKKWPVPPPTPGEIAEAKSEEEAKVIKQKKSESVSHLISSFCLH